MPTLYNGSIVRLNRKICLTVLFSSLMALLIPQWTGFCLAKQTIMVKACCCKAKSSCMEQVKAKPCCELRQSNHPQPALPEKDIVLVAGYHPTMVAMPFLAYSDKRPTFPHNLDWPRPKIPRFLSLHLFLS